jgi:ABC-type Zn uptake system ZnuABC Zn-binding protein ZnuA
MKKNAPFAAGMLAILAFAICFSGGSIAAERIHVVATTLDMADFVERIGGDRVDVYAVFRGQTDLHFFEPIPSQVVKLQKADALVVAGLDADIWAKGLIDAARNPRIRFGAPGYIDPSDGITPIQKPAGRIDGSLGDVHPYGNPHFIYTPEHAVIVARNIAAGLARISPADEAFFAANRDALIVEIERTYAELRKELEPFAGTGIIQFHQSWDYFCRTFGLEVVASLEPRPGIPPSPKHLAEVVSAVRSRGARLMLVEPYYPDRAVKYVTRETGIKVLRIPFHLGTKKEISGHLDLVRHNVRAIADALREAE